MELAPRLSLPEAARQETLAAVAALLVAALEGAARTGNDGGGRSAAMLTAAHLEHNAYVDVRHSLVVRMQTHVEPRRPKYALSDHAKALGFRAIKIIDEDLMLSGAGVRRPSFDARSKSRARVVMVLSINVSELCLNGRQ